MMELWKSRAPNKCRFFLWLALQDRCWTAMRRMRHGLQSNATCTLCSKDEEFISHLLLGCVYSSEVWYKALRRFRGHSVAPTRTMNFAQWWTEARKRIGKPLRKAFYSLVILVAWSLWLERKARIFRGAAASPSSCIQAIKLEGDLWCRTKIIDRSQLLAMQSVHMCLFSPGASPCTEFLSFCLPVSLHISIRLAISQTNCTSK
jgi:hypothetical protein